MTEKALIFLEEKKYAELKKLLVEMNPADISEMLSDLPPEKLLLVFRLLPKELAAEIFVEMDSEEQEYLIKAFSDKELKDVIGELFVDDMVDIIEEMPANAVHRILSSTDPETRNSINEILQYPKDSAGSIMTTEFVDLKGTATVADAFERIRHTGTDKETIYTCYVTDGQRKLEGIVSVKTLLLANQQSMICDIMDTSFISVSTLDDKEDVAKIFDKYGLLALPVVDKERRLVGIVTVDDAITVIKEESTEDIEKMAAIVPTDKTYLKTGMLETWKNRIPWLLILMVSATFTGKIISSFESALAAQVALTAYIPMLMDTGGNAGGQASTTIIRGLALNELCMGDILKIIWKEFRVALLCGITLSAVNFIKMLLIDRVGISIAAVVCLTLVLTVLLAKIVGCSLPILAKRLGFDPAVMASPVLTTIVDALSLLVYFNIATSLLDMSGAA